MSDMDAYRDVFVAESAEYVQQITDGLLSLERNPDDREPVEVVFRGCHSLKGMAAAMGYARTAELTHAMEDLMDRVRSGDLMAERHVIDLILAAVDLVRDLIAEEMEGRSELDPGELIGTLRSASNGAILPDQDAVGPGPAVESSDDPSLADADLHRVTVTLDEACVLKAVRAYMVIKRLAHMGTVVTTVPSTQDIEDEKFDRVFEIVLASSATDEEIREAAAHVSEVASAVVAPHVEAERHGAESPEATGRSVREARRVRNMPKLSETQTVRVAIGHLDNLVDLVGELVILRSKLERLVEERRDPVLVETVDELQRISAELQYEVMLTRMVPVGNIFNRFPRMVRDLASDLGKDVDFEMEGLDIELDRTVLDEIGDPLVHLLRNSLDHGIEDSETRVSAGKSPRGSIRLIAAREREYVEITVADDGRGIDPDRVWDKACQRGMVAPQDRDEYDTDDILLFTCIPGFSTVETATKASGRGVGMDVVKGKIEHLGGTLRIRSERGRGTRFVLRLPLTLAIVQALLVRSEDQMFALPLSAVNEVMLAEEAVVDTVDGAPVVILREGEVAPLHRLDAILFGRDRTALPEPRSSIVLVESGDHTKALHVDDLAGRKEIVVKPLSRVFRDSRGFSGATILGDGCVTLILDPRTLFEASEVH